MGHPSVPCSQGRPSAHTSLAGSPPLSGALGMSQACEGLGAARLGCALSLVSCFPSVPICKGVIRGLSVEGQKRSAQHAAW